ncbi:hypothetical protein BZL30_7000 [Mycobacterium kansasii]|uniref:Uncharacterized protein n=1 Tax=Mycobacterium kansasii TaxID=1768 RepID=A0A1V3WNV8_MYCKA|nr:hypothetical protein MKSMC1_04320 [Mycobacterium kansasii]OOK68653.1 hypothetical protein BZL30_7000 [Mycobacterium kansasii]
MNPGSPICHSPFVRRDTDTRETDPSVLAVRTSITYRTNPCVISAHQRW